MVASSFSRRSLLSGAVVTVAAGVAGYLVARNGSAAQPSGSSSYANGYAPPSGGQGRYLAPVSRVPTGGGIVLPGAQVVLVKSQQGQVHGLSAVCTHQGCTVGSVTNGVIMCPCHGSEFNTQTGAVVRGPATRPLPEVAVTVRGSAVYEG